MPGICRMESLSPAVFLSFILIHCETRSIIILVSLLAVGMSDCSRKMAEFEEPHKTCCGDGAKSIKFDKPEA